MPLKYISSTLVNFSKWWANPRGFWWTEKHYYNLVHEHRLCKNTDKTKRNGSYKNTFKNQDCSLGEKEEKIITML